MASAVEEILGEAAAACAAEAAHFEDSRAGELERLAVEAVDSVGRFAESYKGMMLSIVRLGAIVKQIRDVPENDANIGALTSAVARFAVLARNISSELQRTVAEHETEHADRNSYAAESTLNIANVMSVSAPVETVPVPSSMELSQVAVWASEQDTVSSENSDAESFLASAKWHSLLKLLLEELRIETAGVLFAADSSTQATSELYFELVAQIISDLAGFSEKKLRTNSGNVLNMRFAEIRGILRTLYKLVANATSASDDLSAVASAATAFVTGIMEEFSASSLNHHLLKEDVSTVEDLEASADDDYGQSLVHCLIDVNRFIPSQIVRRDLKLIQTLNLQAGGRARTASAVASIDGVEVRGIAGVLVVAKEYIGWQGSAFGMTRQVRLSSAQIACVTVFSAPASMTVVLHSGEEIKFSVSGSESAGVHQKTSAVFVAAERVLKRRPAGPAAAIESDGGSILKKCELVESPTSTCFIKQGELASSGAMYQILHGTVAVSIDGRAKMASLGPGDVFGELTFLVSIAGDSTTTFPASVIAETDARLLRLRPQSVNEVLTSVSGSALRASFHKFLASNVAAKLGTAAAKMTSMSGHAANIHDVAQMEVSSHHRIVEVCAIKKFGAHRNGLLFFAAPSGAGAQPALYFGVKQFGGLRQVGYFELFKQNDDEQSVTKINALGAKKIELQNVSALSASAKSNVRLKFSLQSDRDSWKVMLEGLVKDGKALFNAPVIVSTGYQAMRREDWDHLLNACSTRVELTAGEIVIKHGTAPDGLFQLLRGRLDVVVKRKQIAEVAEGDMVGEVSFLTHRPAMADVVVGATSDGATLVRLQIAQLDRVLSTNHDIAARFFGHLALTVARRLTVTSTGENRALSPAIVHDFSDSTRGIKLYKVAFKNKTFAHAFTVGDVLGWLHPRYVKSDAEAVAMLKRMKELHVIFPLVELDLNDLNCPLTLGHSAVKQHARRDMQFMIEIAEIQSKKNSVSVGPWLPVVGVISNTHLELMRASPAAGDAHHQWTFLHSRIELQSISAIWTASKTGISKKVAATLNETPSRTLAIVCRAAAQGTVIIRAYSLADRLKVTLALSASHPHSSPASIVASQQMKSPYSDFPSKDACPAEHLDQRIADLSLWERDAMLSLDCPYDNSTFISGKHLEPLAFKELLSQTDFEAFARTDPTLDPLIIYVSRGLVRLPSAPDVIGMISVVHSKDRTYSVQLPLRVALSPLDQCMIVAQSLCLNPTTSETKNPRIQWTSVHPKISAVVEFEERSRTQIRFKFGLVPIYKGQTDENAIFSNATSPMFDKFVNLLGTRIALKGFQQYAGGLDTKSDATGSESVFTNFDGYDIMFHVVPMLPLQPSDAQRLERKRHVGNDLVVIIYQDAGQEPFVASRMVNQFNHVFIVCSPNPDRTTGGWLVAVTTKAGVGRFGPPTPSVPVPDGHLRNFVLAKAINGERAALASPEFKAKLGLARKAMLTNLLNDPDCFSALTIARAAWQKDKAKEVFSSKSKQFSFLSSKT